MMSVQKINTSFFVNQKKRISKILRICFLFLLVSVLMIGDISPYHAYGQVQPIEEMESKLESISGVEKEILQELFTLSQNIEETKRKSLLIDQELYNLNTGVEELRIKAEELQHDYSRQVDVLERLLVHYQRNGPASYLETLLDAKSLTAFLKGMNMVKDISRNTSELLFSIEEGKKQLEADKFKLAEREKEVEEAALQYQLVLEEMIQLKEEQETILDSLAEQRKEFEGELSYIQSMWDEIKLLFKDIILHFNNIIYSGDLTIDMLNLQIKFPKIRGRLYEKDLNEIMNKQTDIPEISFSFHEDYINVEVPEKRLSLKCHFIIEERKSVEAFVDAGSFYGAPLTEGSISELLKDGTLVINFSEVIGFITVESAETFEGYMEFVLVPNLN